MNHQTLTAQYQGTKVILICPMQCCLQICLAALINVKYLTRPRIQGVAIKTLGYTAFDFSE